MKNKFPITATFIDEITYDIPALNWSFEQWKKDFDNMQEIGIDTVVLMRGGFYDKAVYPSKIFPTLKKDDEDFAGLIFQEAQKRNMRVFMGLYISNLCWNDGDAIGEINKNKIYIDEVLSRYKDFTSFEGWYIPHEVAYNTYSIEEVMGGISALCKDKTPNKKVMISPFFNSEAIKADFVFSPERTFDEWDKILKNCGQYIDICAFQDGTAPLDQYENYLKSIQKVCNKYDISLWANVETFERDVREMFFPIPFDVLRRKIEIAEPIVEKMITFEFSHFLSPQSIFPSAHNLNSLYKKYYGNK